MSAQFPEYFALFGLVPRFGIDAAQLTRAYREVLSQVHPDRFAAAGPAERRAAMQLASHANEAYETLRADAPRALYLCKRQGIVFEGAGAVPLAPAFLERQMRWHEMLDDAGATQDGAALVALQREVLVQRDQTLQQIGQRIDDDGDHAAAAVAVRALMFLDKLAADIDRAITKRSDALAPKEE